MSLASFAPISTTGRTLSEEQLAQYNRDGYIIVRGLLDSEEIGKMKALHARAEVLSQERGESFKLNGAHYDVEALPPGHPQGKAVALRKIQEVFKSEQDYVDVMSSEKVLDIVADLIGDDIYYHSSKLMCKPAHGGRRKPWHQDWAYWQEMNTNQVTMWCAIDPSTRENGCIQAIPGSHKRGYVEHSHQEDYMIDEFGIENEHIVFAEMQPGDALFFSVLTLHASDPNNSDKNRLSSIIDFDSQPPPEGHGYGSQTPFER